MSVESTTDTTMMMMTVADSETAHHTTHKYPARPCFFCSFVLFKQTNEEKSEKKTQNLIELFLLLLRGQQTVCFFFVRFHFSYFMPLLFGRQRAMTKVEITIITINFHSCKRMRTETRYRHFRVPFFSVDFSTRWIPNENRLIDLHDRI